MKSTAIERRGLIALAIILVGAVAAIAVWRGESSVARESTGVPDKEAVEHIRRAAQADSAASAVKSHSPRTKARTNKKSQPYTRRNEAPKRRNMLDEQPN